VEKEIHYAFQPERVNENREFFTVTPDRVIPFFKRLQIEEATIDINKELCAIASKLCFHNKMWLRYI